MLEIGGGEVCKAYPRPAVWPTDIQEKHGIALIQQTYEIRLDCTIKEALHGCRQPRREGEMRKVSEPRRGKSGRCRFFAPEEMQNDQLRISLHISACHTLQVMAEAGRLLSQGRRRESDEKLEEHGLSVCQLVGPSNMRHQVHVYNAAIAVCATSSWPLSNMQLTRLY